MDRDAEERLIAYVMLCVAGMATVAWYAWMITAARPDVAFSLFVVGSVGMVIVSILAGPLAMGLGPRLGRDWTMVARQVTLALVAGTVAGTAYVLLWGPDGAIITAGTALAVVAVWAVVPLAIGAMSATGGGTTMLSVVVAWPASNLLALAVFSAPSAEGGIDFASANVMALDGPVRAVALIGIAVVVTLGPTMFGKVIDRYVYREGPSEAAEGD